MIQEKGEKLDKFLDENLSEAVGVSVEELSLEKVHELLAKTETSGVLKSKRGGKIGINRVFISRKEREIMKTENDLFLKNYKK